jgi:hypothetical protein
MAELERTELVEKIKKAFKQTPFPGRKIGDKEELGDFSGKTWKDITVSDINRNYTLVFFNKEGLQYYLPVYLITVLEKPDQVSDYVRDALIRELGYAVIDKRLSKYFTKAQREAILDFFKSYEFFFPYPLPDDLSDAQYHLAKQKFDERRLHMEEAIKYWQSSI